MIDIILLLIVAGITWCVASEGPWGAASTLLAVILAGLLSMNFFEPLAVAFPGSSGWQMRADFICLLGLFAAFVTGLRMACEYLMPTSIAIPPLAYDAARWGLGAATGYVTMAILLTALHTAPLPREFLDFKAKRSNLFNAFAPDRQWLGFTQYVSERVFTTGNVFDGTTFDPLHRGQPQVWSSFPMRYAQRREMYAAGSAVAAAPPPGAVSAPPPTMTPSAGGGGQSF